MATVVLTPGNLQIDGTGKANSLSEWWIIQKGAVVAFLQRYHKKLYKKEQQDLETK